MTEPANTGTNSNQRRFPKNPYRNILFCALCGAPMRYEHRNLNGANPYVAYVCSAALKSGQCSHHRTRFTFVDNLIREALAQEINLANSIYMQIESGDTLSGPKEIEKQLQDEIQQILEAIRKANLEFQLLHTEFLVGNIRTQEYLQDKQDLHKTIGNAGQQVLVAVEKIQDLRHLISKDNPWLHLYQGKSLPDVLPQKISKTYLKRVLLSPEGEISVTFREQDWKHKLLDIMEV